MADKIFEPGGARKFVAKLSVANEQGPKSPPPEQAAAALRILRRQHDTHRENVRHQGTVQRGQAEWIERMAEEREQSQKLHRDLMALPFP
jgi:hypothetical protein